MKILYFYLILAMSCDCAFAHPINPPDSATVAESDAVYVIRAEKPVPNGILFKVMETLRGPTQSDLALTVSHTDIYLKTYPTGSTWLIFRQPHGSKNVIGWTIVGDCEWAPVPVFGTGLQESAQGIGSINSLKEYLVAHPYHR